MEKSNKNSTILIVFACVYAVLCIIGSAINSAVNYESFGRFLQLLVSGVYGVFVFAIWIILIWAIKVKKGKDTIISERIMAWLLTAVFIWIFCSALTSYIGYIVNAAQYGKYDMTYNLSDSDVGGLIINVLWVITAIVVFVMLKMPKVIAGFFKDMKGEKEIVVEPVAETPAEGEVVEEKPVKKSKKTAVKEEAPAETVIEPATDEIASEDKKEGE